MIDPSDAKAMRAEAERRLKMRAEGKRLVDLPPASPPVDTVRTAVFDPFEGMNKTERQRAIELEAMRRAGVIAAWWFEAVTLKLAHDLRYTPDFLIQENDGTLRFEEIKGFFRDDAKAKARVAAKLFPFPLRILFKRKGGTGWTTADFRREDAA